jgi:hypothetical protein
MSTVVAATKESPITSRSSLAEHKRDAMAPAMRLRALVDRFNRDGTTPKYHVIAARAVAALHRGGAWQYYGSAGCVAALRLALHGVATAFNTSDQALSRMLSFATCPDAGGNAHEAPKLSDELANERITLQLFLLARRHACPTLHLALTAGNVSRVAAANHTQWCRQVDMYRGVSPALQHTHLGSLVAKAKVTTEDAMPDKFLWLIVQAWTERRMRRTRDLSDSVMCLIETFALLKALSVAADSPLVYPTVHSKLDGILDTVVAILEANAGPALRARDLRDEVVKANVSEGSSLARVLAEPLVPDNVVIAIGDLLHVDILGRLQARFRAAQATNDGSGGDKAEQEGGNDASAGAPSASPSARQRLEDTTECAVTTYMLFALAAKAVAEQATVSTAVSLAIGLRDMSDQLAALSAAIQCPTAPSEGQQSQQQPQQLDNKKDNSLTARLEQARRLLTHCRFALSDVLEEPLRSQFMPTRRAEGGSDREAADSSAPEAAAPQPVSRLATHVPLKVELRASKLIPRAVTLALLDEVHEIVSALQRQSTPTQPQAKNQSAQRTGKDANRTDEDMFGEGTDDAGAVSNTSVSHELSSSKLGGNSHHTSELPVDPTALKKIEALLLRNSTISMLTVSSRLTWLRFLWSVLAHPHLAGAVAPAKLRSFALAVELFLTHECLDANRHVAYGINDSFSFANGVLECLSRLPPGPATAEIVRRCAHRMASTAVLTAHQSALPEGTGTTNADEALSRLIAADPEIQDLSLLATMGQSAQKSSAIGPLRVVSFCLSSLARSHNNRNAGIDYRRAIPHEQLQHLLAAAHMLLSERFDVPSFGTVMHTAYRVGLSYADVKPIVELALTKLQPPPVDSVPGTYTVATRNGVRRIPKAVLTDEELNYAGTIRNRDWMTLGEVVAFTDALNLLDCNDKRVALFVVRLHGTSTITAEEADRIASEQEAAFGHILQEAAASNILSPKFYTASKHSFEFGSLRVPCGVTSKRHMQRLRRLLRHVSLAAGDTTYARAKEALNRPELKSLDEYLYGIRFIRQASWYATAIAASRAAESAPVTAAAASLEDTVPGPVALPSSPVMAPTATPNVPDNGGAAPSAPKSPVAPSGSASNNTDGPKAQRPTAIERAREQTREQARVLRDNESRERRGGGGDTNAGRWRGGSSREQQQRGEHTSSGSGGGAQRWERSAHSRGDQMRSSAPRNSDGDGQRQRGEGGNHRSQGGERQRRGDNARPDRWQRAATPNVPRLRKEEVALTGYEAHAAAAAPSAATSTAPVPTAGNVPTRDTARIVADPQSEKPAEKAKVRIVARRRPTSTE